MTEEVVKFQQVVLRIPATDGMKKQRENDMLNEIEIRTIAIFTAE